MNGKVELSKPLLILDFDGVVIDSTEECVVVAWNAWLRFNQESITVRLPEEVPPGPREKLRALRKYVRTAGEYLAILEAEHLGIAINNQADYDQMVKSVEDRISAFADLVFFARNQLREREPDHWISLHTIYPGIREQIAKLYPYFEIYVVTGKDRESVLAFYQKLELPLQEDHVFDKDAGKKKLKVIRDLARTHYQCLSNVVFIDDNIMHLLPLKQAGCRVLMADWGYHTEEHIRLALTEHVPLVSIPILAETIIKMIISS